MKTTTTNNVQPVSDFEAALNELERVVRKAMGAGEESVPVPGITPLSEATTHDPLNGLVEGDAPTDLIGAQVVSMSDNMAKSIERSAAELYWSKQTNPFVRVTEDARGNVTGISAPASLLQIVQNDGPFGAEAIAKSYAQATESPWITGPGRPRVKAPAIRVGLIDE